MNVDRLVTMANDIGAFFDAEPDKVEAAKSIASHLRRFWDPRMRRQIIAHNVEGGTGLKDIVRSAIALLPAVADTRDQIPNK